ncbi:ribonuclease R [Candidatus Gracilibacteria bacterium]|nr:ribonuclease R [Candidatus Gracilibacteria bacterium]
MSEKPRKNFKNKQKKSENKTFYKSTSKKDTTRNKSGKIVKKRNPENELVGIYKQGQGPFGFVDTFNEETGEKKGYFTHESKKGDAFEGDEVAFEVQHFRGKEEALITKVLKRSEHLVVGTLKVGKTYAFVVSKNPLIKTDIFIPGKHIGGHSDGSQVAVQIIKWESKNPEGRIVESLGNLPKGREEIYKIAFEMGARKSFSPAVMDETKELNDYISQSDLKYRNDCRDLLTYTIDGAESKDLDDAISLEKTDSGYILYVHIADVSHYVREDTPLDREARKRGTSIYLADQVIPMLPKEISNGLCSLHPGEDKLTLTCEMHISKSGIVTKSEVYNSVIISDYRLTYQEIDEFVSGDIKSGDDLLFGEKVSEYLSENIQDLKSLTDVLSKNTENRGSLDFDFPETKIILDDQGNPTEYKKSIRYDSYKIIEECMVLANESVSKQFQKHPFLYRVHEDPDGEDVEKFTKMLETVIPGTEIPEDFPGILALLQSSEQLQYLQKLLLRSLSKARYSEKNLGHFGLALKFYSHFTSPIRRYPDLQIHRIIKEICKGKFSSERRGYYNEILPKVARRSSDTADRSEKMEYKVRDMLACKYMSDKIGKQFTANISGMIEKGFFVELPDTIEGFVDYGMTGLTYNPERMLLEDATGKELHFGSEVQVILIDIDTSRMRLEFELV